MARQVAILHGWSDKSESFRPLAKFLKNQGYQAVPIFLGDYISLRDDVNIDDVAKRMEEVVRAKMARPKTARDHLAKEFDLVVHSTGGLVARRWIATNYADRPCPVKNLLMLAPANFGSKLAHIGRSMMGRIAKGWRTGFETGEEMLYALELGSRFQWELAESDLLVEPGSSAGTTQFYGPDHEKQLNVTVSAADPGDRIAYFTREASLRRGLIKIHQMPDPDQRWLKRHRTHLVKVIVPRAADPKIFTLKRG